MTDELAKRRGLDIEHDPWTRALWEATHQSFALRSWVSVSKFGPHRVVCRTPLTNIRITTFFAGEHEMRVLDPSRVELLAAIGCEVPRWLSLPSSRMRVAVARVLTPSVHQRGRHLSR